MQGWGQRQAGPPPWKVWRFLNTHNAGSHNPAIPLVHVYPEHWKPVLRWSYANGFGSAVHSVPKVKQPTCPQAGGRVSRRWYIHMIECYSAIKKDLKNTMLAREAGHKD